MELTISAHKQIMQTDCWGNTPLHLALHHQPPVEVVSQLLEVASKVEQQSTTSFDGCKILSMTNYKHSTPLCIACHHGASYDVIEELLYPSMSNASHKLASSGGATVGVADCGERTPFSLLIMRYETYRIFPQYKTTYTKIEDVTDIQQVTLSHTIRDDEASSSLSSSNPVVEEEYGYVSRGTASSKSPAAWADGDPKVVQHKLQELGSTIEQLILASWWNADDDATDNVNAVSSPNSVVLRQSFHSMIHGAAYVAESCPTKLTDMLFRLHGDSATADDGEDDAVSPLHLAVTVDKQRRHQTSTSKYPSLAYQRKHFIDKLLELDPCSATKPVPGTLNRSPFCQAILSGLTWHNNATVSSELDRDSQQLGPLQSILKHSPESLYSCDEESGLYPFMLAATTTSSYEDDDATQLDTIYSLLRHYPQVLVI